MGEPDTLPWPGPITLAFVEGLYEDFLREPSSVSADWQHYFKSIGDGELRFPTPRFGPSFKPASIFNPPTPARAETPERAMEPTSAAF